jgi:GNAT superfamily N-acetyltransferase
MLSIRPALAGDVPALKVLIHELAEFERLPVAVTETALLRDGFEGRAGVFLEDLYVRDQFRGKGIGKALLAWVASVARQENCFGVRWQVLDWNTPAIDFYKSLGATFLDEWKTVSLDGDALARVAELPNDGVSQERSSQ